MHDALHSYGGLLRAPPPFVCAGTLRTNRFAVDHGVLVQLNEAREGRHRRAVTDGGGGPSLSGKASSAGDLAIATVKPPPERGAAAGESAGPSLMGASSAGASSADGSSIGAQTPLTTRMSSMKTSRSLTDLPAMVGGGDQERTSEATPSAAGGFSAAPIPSPLAPVLPRASAEAP